MDSNNTNLTGYVGSTISILSGVVGLEYGLNIVLLVIGIIGGVLAIFRSLYLWYKDAKKDGKITKDEIIELGEKINPQVDNVIKQVEDLKDENNRTTKK